MLTILAFAISSEAAAACCLQPPVNYALPIGSVRPEAVAFSPLNNALVTANGAVTNSVTFFRMSNGILQLPGTSYTLPSFGQVPSALAFSPIMRISQYVAVGSNGEYPGTAKITLFKQMGNGLQYVNDKGLPSSDPGFVQAVTFSSNGTYVAAASDAHKVTLFRLTSNGLDNGISYSLPAQSSPSALAFSRDSSYLVTANSFTNKVTLFRMVNGTLQLVNTYPIPNGLSPKSIAFSPDGIFVATANRNSSNITIFKLIDGVLSGGISYPLAGGFSRPTSLAFTKDGLCLAVCCENGGAIGVAFYSISANGVLTLADSESAVAGRPTGIAVSPTSPFCVAAANYDANSVSIFKTNC